MTHRAKLGGALPPPERLTCLALFIVHKIPMLKIVIPQLNYLFKKLTNLQSVEVEDLMMNCVISSIIPKTFSPYRCP